MVGKTLFLQYTLHIDREAIVCHVWYVEQMRGSMVCDPPAQTVADFCLASRVTLVLRQERAMYRLMR